MGTVQLALMAGNPHSQLYVEELPCGLLAIMLGMHRVEVVPRSGPLYRMAVGRLVNAGWPVTVVGDLLGHDSRTVRTWADALLCLDRSAMPEGLSGRGAAGKVTETIVEFALDWWEELRGRTRDFRKRILAKIEQVFKVSLSWEALRPALLALLAARSRDAGLAEAASAEAGEDLPGAASGCAAEFAAEFAPDAGTQVVAAAVMGLRAGGPPAATGRSASGGGTAAAAGCAAEAGSKAAAAVRTQVAAAAGSAARTVPNGGAAPSGGPVLAFHAGQALAAKWLDLAGATPAADGGMPLAWCAQIMQGAANIEQVRDVAAEDLARFTGVPACRARTQRERLLELCSDPDRWLGLLGGNAALLPDGPGRGTVFYYDPHTKEYTGQLPFLKGWCGRRHGVAKVLHLDFLHTRSGHPCFVLPADNYLDMRERVFLELELFDRLFPPEARAGRTFVVDRGIFGIDTFGRLDRRGDWLITWEKGYGGDGWREGAATARFSLARPRNHSGDLRLWEFAVQEAPWERDPSWRRLVVRATTPEGRTTEVGVLCSNPAMPAEEATTLIFSRWLQENDFRILDAHFGMMQMTSRRSRTYAQLAATLPDRPIESIEYRQLRREAAGLRQAQARLLYDRERLADALARTDRDRAAAEARLGDALPKLDERFARCRAATKPELAELAALGTLAAELKACRETVRRAAGGLPRMERRQALLQAGIDANKQQLAALEERMEKACSTDSKLRFLAAEGYRRPDTAPKHLMDCVKIVARNAVYRLLADFRRHYDNRRDDLAILQRVLRAPGTMRVEHGVLRVGLWLCATLEPAVLLAVDAFLRDVSRQINEHFQGRAMPVEISLLPGAPEL